MKNSEVLMKANMPTYLMVTTITFLWGFVSFFLPRFFDGSIEKPDGSFDGSNDIFLVD